MSFGTISLSPDDKPDGFVLLSMYEKLESENAKLRELMSVMAYCIQGWRECDGCRVNGGAGIITERAGCYVLLDRLRDLGWVVD